MLFSGIPFLFYFLPAALLLYLITPKKLRNMTLFLVSLFFYGWGEPIYVFLMLGTILSGYVLGLLIGKYREGRLGKLFLVLSIVIPLFFLGYFKYADFFIENFARAFGVEPRLLGIALPIGISFYTFQILSYTVDVYRGDVAAQKNPIALGAYITMFPQLIAGPIVRYSDVASQLESREHSFEKVSSGVRRFTFGLAKKILIANQLGELCDVFIASQDKSVAFFWLYGIAFALQIYFDFSGYSDMAIGLGKLFGFEFPENFNFPFISSSVTEFWRRWHISLGSWFRDYVYIPLGGNRKGKIRHLFNILVVWMLTGFWHGAEWNFIVWGLYFAILLALEKFIFGNALRKRKILGHIYVIFTVLISFVIFSANNMTEASGRIFAMFGGGDYPFINAEFLYYLRSFLPLLVIACVGATPLMKRIFTETRFGRALAILEPFTILALLALSTAYLVDGSFNPFLYFRF